MENVRERRESFRKCCEIQFRVVVALILREVITRYGRHNIGFLWLFVEPMTFTVGVTALWSLTRAIHGGDLPIAAFALTGYSCVLVWRNMPNRLIGAIEPNLSLMYHRNVKVLDIFLARLILEMGGVATSFALLTLFFWGVGMIDLPEDPLKVVEGWLMLAWFGASLGMFLGGLAHRHDIVDKFWHPFTYLIFPLSGAGFLVYALPPAMQKFILILPMVHGVECVRDGFFGSHFPAMYSLSYMAIVCLVLTWLSLLQIKKVENNLVPA